jgi:hypothetical protein
VPFESFERNFRLTPAGQSGGEPWRDERLVSVPGYLELAGKYAGCSFENGLYRLHDAVTGPRATGWLATAFASWASNVRPFGYDWLGREFCVDYERVEDGEPQVLLVDMEEDDAYFVPRSFRDFHETLMQEAEATLELGRWNEWAAANPDKLPLRPSDCAAYKVPVFLGGQIGTELLEVTDIDVYWTLTSELLAGSRALKPGTRISGIETSGT